jgi:hypothetical protein
VGAAQTPTRLHSCRMGWWWRQWDSKGQVTKNSTAFMSSLGGAEVTSPRACGIPISRMFVSTTSVALRCGSRVAAEMLAIRCSFSP